MAAGAYLDACGFNPTSGGTATWTVSAGITGYQTPAQAGASNAVVYSYRAESNDKSQWEEGYGAYTVSGTTLTRSTITANSLGGTTAINFTSAPNVFITAASADLRNASLLNSGTVAQAQLGSGSGGAGTKALFDDSTYKVVVSNGVVSSLAYASSQTIAIPAGVTRAKFILWGGSGGGTKASVGPCCNVNGGAGGGGAGALIKYLTGLTAGNTLSLTVGAAGAGGSSPGAGGNSTLVSGTQTISTLTANGGGTASIGGSGGTASGGDLNVVGGTGNPNGYSGGTTGLGFGVGGKGSGSSSAGTVGIVGGCLIDWLS